MYLTSLGFSLNFPFAFDCITFSFHNQYFLKIFHTLAIREYFTML